MLIGVLSYFPVRALFRRIFISDWQAALCAAIWLLAPTLVSSVAWLSCVNIQLMCAFAALALCLHDRETVRDRILVALFLFLALVSYENAVVIGPIAVAFDFFLRPHRLRKRSSWVVYGAYAAVTLVYLSVRHVVGSGTSVSGSFDAVPRLEMCGASAYFTLQHFLSWLWPFGRFTVFGGYCHNGVSALVLAGSWLAVVAMVVMALVCWKRRPVCAFGLCTALVGFLPVSNLAGLGNGPYGDYYLGISSFGLAAVMVDLIGWCWSVMGKLRPVVRLLAVGLIGLRLAAVPEAARWARLWGDGMMAYEESVRNFPEVFSNWLKLAQLKCNGGDFAAALAACDAAESRLEEQSSQRMESYQVRAFVAFTRDGNADMALLQNEKARSVARPGAFESDYHQFRGCVFEDLQNDIKAAKSEYEQVVAAGVNMDSVDSANRLARLRAVEGDLEGAITLWERALKICPDDELIRHNLVRARGLK